MNLQPLVQTPDDTRVGEYIHIEYHKGKKRHHTMTVNGYQIANGIDGYGSHDDEDG